MTSGIWIARRNARMEVETPCMKAENTEKILVSFHYFLSKDSVISNGKSTTLLKVNLVIFQKVGTFKAPTTWVLIKVCFKSMWTLLSYQVWFL